MPNLEVIKAMQSLTSKGLVKTQFSWQWYYYALTPEGVDFLREWYVFTLAQGWSPQLTLVDVGSTYPLRSCPQRTKRQFVLRAPRAFVDLVEERVLTARPVVTGMTTGRRRMRLASSGHGSLVWAEGLLGSRRLCPVTSITFTPSMWRTMGDAAGCYYVLMVLRRLTQNVV